MEVITYPMTILRTRHCWIAGAAAISIAMAAIPGCGAADRSEFDDADGKNDAGGSVGFGTSDGGDSGPNPLTSGCATASAEARRTPVYLQFVIDGSGSMDGRKDAFTFVEGEREPDPMTSSRLTGKKWIAVRGALSSFFDDLAEKQDSSFAVGLYLFSSDHPKSPSDVDVPIGYVDKAQSALLKARLSPPVFPLGATPLCTSIEGQIDVLTAYTPSAPVQPDGKYVLVAMSDGVPTLDPSDCAGVIGAARTGTKPVVTFAVGVGNEDAAPSVYDEHFMSQLAVAGGTAAAGCNENWGDADKSGVPCHFQITPGTKSAAEIRADFLAAINTIRDAVASCEFPLSKPAGSGSIDPNKVNVVVTSGGTDKTVPQDDANGWIYDDPTNPTKVTFRGTACNEIKADPTAKVKIVIGCKTITTK